MTVDPTSTIVAIATAPAAGGVGIVRLSGPRALQAALPLCPGAPGSPEPRHAYLCEFVDEAGRPLDQGLFLYFRAPGSFTGEEVVELHAHGSLRLLELLVGRVLASGLARAAEPGEFTRRAFQNGRLDLARAEAVADLVAAGSEAAVRAAAAQAGGALSARVGALREGLLRLRAELEGALDFPGEADFEGFELEARLQGALGDAAALLEGGARGLRVRRGARVVLFGPVNAGKSTLFNRLVGEERALVDDEPGTTRDAVEARLEWEGLGLSLVDTAGLRGAEGPGRVEALGILKTRAALKEADLAVLLVPPKASAGEVSRWREEAGKTPVMVLAGKADLGAPLPDGARAVSGLTGEGVSALRAWLLATLFEGGMAEAVLLTSERHAAALRRAVLSLERAKGALAPGALEVVAGELGLAVEALGEITGESASQELVDEIFRRFCLGK
ncbi:MAG: tRNA modification GTPase [Myxococcaceae bacterium]